jgi:hypothetical protein
MIDGERYHVVPVPELQQEERHAAGHSCRRQVPPQREQGPLQVRGRKQLGEVDPNSNRGLGKDKNVA